MSEAIKHCQKLIVGRDISKPDGDSRGELSPVGTAILNGPVVCGKVNKTHNDYVGVLNVSSDSVPQHPNRQPVLDVKLAAKVDGNVKIDGDSKTANALDVTGNINQDGNIVTTGTIDTNGSQINVGFVNGTGASAAVKAFDIEHPSKSGHRLRHICLEGPESAIYYRGRLKGSNIIELPYYWKDLVHEDSITVQLQPIGKSQNLVIESFNSSYVVIELGANQDFLTNEILIDCFYHVYAERKDVEKLIPEYEGNSWNDYPGDNSVYSINK